MEDKPSFSQRWVASSTRTNLRVKFTMFFFFPPLEKRVITVIFRHFFGNDHYQAFSRETGTDVYLIMYTFSHGVFLADRDVSREKYGRDGNYREPNIDGTAL